MPRRPTVPLRDYIESRIDDLDRRTHTAQLAAKEAVDKAEAANERRLGLLNEFRAQQADESRKYAPSILVDQQFDGIERRIARNEQAIATLQGRALALAGAGALTGGLVTGLIFKLAGG